MNKTIKYILLSIGIGLLLIAIYFFTIKKLDRDVLDLKNYNPTKSSKSLAFNVPTAFIDNARFYIKIPLINGDSILGFGDTGGGLSMMMPTTIEDNNLQPKIKTGILKGIMPFDYILYTDLVEDTNFPKPFPLRSFILRKPFRRITEPYLVIPPMDDEMKHLIESMPEMEAFLGQSFFMDKAWTIDYINRQIWVNTPLSEAQLRKPNVQKLGFKKNNHNENIYGHARMYIEIDGEIIDVLFDTGATIVLSENGKKEMNTSAITIAGSFIASSIFDKWRKEHPEWKYYPKADMSRDVIEVPVIKIGGIEVGPVLFSKRPDENWSKGMIRSMDKVVKGAIGGSALKYFKVTIDYNSELIRFKN